MHLNLRHATGALVQRDPMTDPQKIRNETAINHRRPGSVEFLMAKAYRGVAYVDAHHNAPAQSQQNKQLKYRGVSHARLNLEQYTGGGEPRHLIYRGQGYTH